MELGALTVMTIGFRERELILDIFEMITGLRMNHAYIRPGGVAQDLPPGAIDKIREFLKVPKELARVRQAAHRQPDLEGPAQGRRLPRPRPAAWRSASPARCCASDRPAVGPAQDRAVLRLRDLRLRRPTRDRGRRLRPVRGPAGRDARVAEDRRAGARPAGQPGPGHGRRQEDRLAGAARHRRRRHGQLASTTSAHHGRVDGGTDPPLQAGHRGLPGARRARPTPPIESPRGELGCHVVSDGGTRPYRVHFRDPSFINLQATAACARAAMIADVIVAVASIDPVMGGVDR